MKIFYKELYPALENINDVSMQLLKGVDELARQNWDNHGELQRVIEGRIKKHKQYKQHAFPDSIQAEADLYEPPYLNTNVNIFPL